MSYEAGNEHELLGQFASGQGYEDLVETVGKGAKYPALYSLVLHGASENVPAVCIDLVHLAAFAKDSDVGTTALALHNLIRHEEMIVITNGMEPDDEDTSKADDTDFQIEGTIVKVDAAQHLVFGWASIVTVGDRPVTDTQGDQIQPDTLEDAAYSFTETAGKAGEMHEGTSGTAVTKIGQLVESIVFTPEKTAAMLQSLQAQGIPAVMTMPFCGWWVGFKITDADCWARIVSGELKAFSVGGKGKRASI